MPASAACLTQFGRDRATTTRSSCSPATTAASDFRKIWPFVGRKFDLLEGGLRVPQICRWSGRIEPGRITDRVSITMDLTATCLAAAGVGPDPRYPLDGVDLFPVLTGQAAEFERTLYW